MYKIDDVVYHQAYADDMIFFVKNDLEKAKSLEVILSASENF
jgi:hypothetical protein